MHKAYLNRIMFDFFCLGISSGIPFFLALSTLNFWLTESSISSALIGVFSWITIPYSFKFLWSPFLDRFNANFSPHSFLGYKVWAIISQFGVIITTIILGFLTPQNHILWIAIIGFLLSFCAANLDITIDTIRIELLDNQKTGFAAATESIGFRLGMLIGGGGALYLATIFNWKFAYFAMGIFQMFSLPIIWFLPLQSHRAEHAQRIPSQILQGSFQTYFKKSFLELKERTPFLYLLIFVFIFKIPDTLLNAMLAPFLNDIGFSKLEYANITKTFGIPLMVTGSFVAGYLIHQFNYRFVAALVLFFQVTSCLLFYLQYHIGHDVFALMITIGIESFTSGMTATTFIFMLSSHCQSPFSAGHFTFLNAIGSFSRIIFSTLSGFIAEFFGWGVLFMVGIVGVFPAFSCLLKIRDFDQETQNSNLSSIKKIRKES